VVRFFLWCMVCGVWCVGAIEQLGFGMCLSTTTATATAAAAAAATTTAITTTASQEPCARYSSRRTLPLPLY